VELISSQGTEGGFTGGLVVVYPNSTKAKKLFLCLMTGGQQPLPANLGVIAPGSKKREKRAVILKELRKTMFS